MFETTNQSTSVESQETTWLVSANLLPPLENLSTSWPVGPFKFWVDTAAVRSDARSRIAGFFRKKGGRGSYLEDDHPSQWGSRGFTAKNGRVPTTRRSRGLTNYGYEPLTNWDNPPRNILFSRKRHTNWLLLVVIPAGIFFLVGIDLTFSGEFPRTLPNLKQ